jgi:methyltransferase FkbM-like protein
MRLDTYCSERELSDVDLIKLDTESTEPRVLRGAIRVLEESRPDIICEVLHGRTEHELEQVLRPLAYSFYQLTPSGPQRRSEIRGDAEYRHLNYLFSQRRELG